MWDSSGTTGLPSRRPLRFSWTHGPQRAAEPVPEMRFVGGHACTDEENRGYSRLLPWLATVPEPAWSGKDEE
ncbi:hypothetical protein ABEX25_01525 [Paenibacillus thiaminolyticus]|uniref:hypothetical protein n=1 Tax=Paenibacillus thiaminolyticus TaxID=49283 RepID=UPI003D2D504F